MSARPLYPPFSVILVDDETEFLNAASFALRREGIFNVETISDGRAVIDRLKLGGCGILALDMTMPYVNGKEILARVSEEFPEVFAFMVTAANDVHTAVECMKLGARDYILKPLQHAQLCAAVRRAIESKTLMAESAALKARVLDDSLGRPEAFASIITNDAAMRNLFKYVEAIAATDLPVLITGETGTGKELMAQAVHALSGRSGRFVCVNIAGIDETMFADTLFGHVRGAFTGADRDRGGLIGEAADGTLFLDEIGDLRAESQVKLLRLLQEGSYRPLGSNAALTSNARFIFATNRDIKALMRTGRFRNDLYYRLQAHEVKIPPLRERPGDLRLLADAFVGEASGRLGKRCPYINQELYALLSTYSWPGNVRELKGLLFDAVSRNTTDTLSLVYLKGRLRELRGEDPGEEGRGENADRAARAGKAVTFSASLPTAVELEMMLILEALRRTGGNKTLTADLLGVARATVIKRLKEAGPEQATGPAHRNGSSFHSH